LDYLSLSPIISNAKLKYLFPMTTHNTQADRDAIERSVRERLEFVDIITRLNSLFLDPSLIRDTPEGWDHPWRYFDSLRNYLLLTCFDLLGQTSCFMDFQAWLCATSAETERLAALAKVSESNPPIEVASIIHREYLAFHGTKVSFFRFIDEIIPAPARAALLYSIRIRRIDPKLNKEIEVVESDSAKKKFLFTVRNMYTHKAVNTGSAGGGVWPGFGGPIVIDGVARQGWIPIHWEHKANLRIEYSVRDWPNVLRETIIAGLRAMGETPAIAPPRPGP
jgi:hypothetical protein